jgi:hypothetical protein
MASNRLFGPKNSLNKVYFENSFNMRFLEVNDGMIDTWDYSLLASVWRNNFKSIQINANLVLNAGFTVDATHTTLTPPDWVPTDYCLPRSESLLLADYDPCPDLWLSKNVYNCSLVDLLKNEVKKVIRK